ncbi:ArnT family glycosyltransferase [Zobellia galactanivorans]|uniref:Glycosyltransferase, family GT83 n=1 Tax=Zobellia galactanivorans (strain DSM 12802 / CCUG 47099 / CIP 106680 / NCIMB 13871 / Dsij) TaxID=63186 RepID=G0LAJ5_ZOBGA|nr:glycosyltransferase family 39 protein [Zobellia galactanivorans]CAZ95364.1 Glycosyltransferase, family GT83 [Zobellia galactanivorans]
MKSKLPRLFLIILGIGFLINLLQSYFTPLIFDEAYYWHFAKKMSWGYFDHPPLVALLIKISSFFFDGELGVRFMSCVLSTATLLILWNTIDHPKKNQYVVHYFVLAYSMTLLNAYGFFTLPDTPLLFFTALLLFLYKKFLEKPRLLWGIAMGIAMAGLMYSKYHAALVIIFILLSNLKLVFNKYAWLSVFIALLCYTPHFIWLYENEFVTINYHLFDRPNDPYNFNKYTLGYFVNLLALFGLTFPWVYWALFKTKANDKFTRALLFLVYGVLIFFFISSFNRRIQTQWIIVISIPLVIIVFRFMMENEVAKKWIYRMGLTNIALILYLRVGLVYEPMSPIYYETHGNIALAEDVRAAVGDMPLVFENSYRKAPMFAFYSGNTTYSLNNESYRRNQYSIDDSESKVQHQKVLYLSGRASNADLTFTKSNGSKIYGRYIDNFESFRKLKTLLDGPIDFNLEKEQTFQLYNPYDFEIDLSKLRFNVAYMTDFKIVIDRLPISPKPNDPNITSIGAKDTITYTFKFPEPKKLKDPKYVRIGIMENGMNYGINGKNTKIK